MPLSIAKTPLAGLVEIATAPVRDRRGAFSRLFCAAELAGVLGGRSIVQVNRSLTRTAGAVRGMHFQRPPAAETKIVRCLRGRAFDVAVDLREGSPTRLFWHAVVLSAAEENAVLIPNGFAHGFQALEAETELLYLHTASYAPEHEGGVRHDDPRLAIAWPLPPRDLSARDRSHPLIDAVSEGPLP